MKTIHLTQRITICISIMLLVGHLNAQNCVSKYTVQMTPWTGDFWTLSLDFVTGPPHDSVKSSLNINGPFSKDFYLTCDNVTNLTGPITVYIEIYDSTVVSTCSLPLVYLDNIAPVISSMQDVVLELDQNGIGKLTPADIDNGSYDICGPVTLEISQTDFNTSHIGINKIYLKATDLYGNYNQGWTNVLVKGYPFLICDTLSRTTPITDCNLGHSDQDDVEWPADISISHDLIEPYDLIYYSTIDPLDAQPSFYNNPYDYTSSYHDSIVFSDASTLILDRKWVAYNSVENLEWDYIQQITIDLTGLIVNEDVVRVLNVVNRDMPGVLINGTIATDEMGEASIVDDIVSLDYTDEALNGINVLDVIEMTHHILGIRQLPLYDQTIPANVNNDIRVSAQDVVLVQRVLLGLAESSWVFIEKETASSLANISNGTYKGYKMGDVNGDATLIGEPEPVYEVIKLYIQDKLLNKGERYTIPIYANEQRAGLGLELKLHYEDIIFENITNTQGAVLQKLETKNEELMIFDLSSSFTGIQSNIPFYTLEIFAEENTLLSNAITRSINKSFFVDDNYKLFELELNVTETIPTGLEDESVATFKVYPNPASSQLFFDIPSQEFDVSLYNASGVKVQSMQNEKQMDVSNLPSGIYTSVVTDHKNVFKKKIILIR